MCVNIVPIIPWFLFCEISCQYCVRLKCAAAARNCLTIFRKHYKNIFYNHVVDIFNYYLIIYKVFLKWSWVNLQIIPCRFKKFSAFWSGYKSIKLWIKILHFSFSPGITLSFLLNKFITSVNLGPSKNPRPYYRNLCVLKKFGKGHFHLLWQVVFILYVGSSSFFGGVVFILSYGRFHFLSGVIFIFSYGCFNFLGGVVFYFFGWGGQLHFFMWGHLHSLSSEKLGCQ